MRYVQILMISLTLFLVACGGHEIETNMSGNVPDFEYTSQDNEPFGLEDLEGKWWIADLIFTNCTTVCIPMTTNMVNLQQALNEKDLDVQLVSFSVDPDYDTPEVLTEYAENYGADLSNWTFLTGYDFQTIKELSIKTFKSPLHEALPGDDQVTHGTRFYLVDPEGNVLKFYDGTKSDELENIIDDLKVLTKK